MTTEIVVSTDDLTVLAPPDTIELLLDFGPTGQRGSQIFSGIGEPADFTSGGQIFGQDLYLNDYYINAAPGSDYSYLYQYRTGAGGSANAWFKLIKINPTIYSAINDVYFTNGDGTIEIPISNITSISMVYLTPFPMVSSTKDWSLILNPPVYFAPFITLSSTHLVI